MPKKAKNTIAKPNKDRAKIAREIREMVSRMSQQIELHDARRRAAHEARAELLRPTLVALQRCAETNGRNLPIGEVPPYVVLQAGDCALVLRCLKEAGFTLDEPKAAGWSVSTMPDGTIVAGQNVGTTEMPRDAAKAA